MGSVVLDSLIYRRPTLGIILLDSGGVHISETWVNAIHVVEDP